MRKWAATPLPLNVGGVLAVVWCLCVMATANAEPQGLIQSPLPDEIWKAEEVVEVAAAVPTLWAEALQRPEVETRREAAAAFAEAARVRPEAVVEHVPLLIHVAQTDADRGVRAVTWEAVARSLRQHLRVTKGVNPIVPAESPITVRLLLDAAEKASGVPLMPDADAALVTSLDQGLKAAMGEMSSDAEVIQTWADRVNNPEATLAARMSAAAMLDEPNRTRFNPGVSGLRDDPAEPNLARAAVLAVALDADAPFPLRLSAARDATALTSHLSEVDITRWEPLASGSTQDRLVLAELLSVLAPIHSQSGPVGVRVSADAAADDAMNTLVWRLANDPNPNVAAEVGPLWGLTQEQRLELAEARLESDDPRLRRSGVFLLSDVEKDAAFDRVMGFLDADDPAVREAAVSVVSRVLIEKDADPDSYGWKRSRAVVVERLSDEDPWMLAEMAWIASARDIEGAVPRLVELLEHEDPTVRLAASRALRRIHVEMTPTQHAAMLEGLEATIAALSAASAEAEAGTLKPPKGMDAAAWAEAQAWQTLVASAVAVDLIVTLAEAGNLGVEPVCLNLARKRLDVPVEVREAAVWGLGALGGSRPMSGSDEGAAPPPADDRLVKLLADRLDDWQGLDPEAMRVRAASAVALGMIGADSRADLLRGYVVRQDEAMEVRLAAWWALEKMRQERPMKPVRVMRPAWFLVPITTR